MKNKKNVIVLLFFLLSILLYSCIEENDRLVNPPSNIETINIRFINFGGDFESRYLTFDGNTPTDVANYATSTNSVHPPADSAFISIRKSGNTEFSLNRMVKFSRNINFSYFALPSPFGDSVYRAVDTIIALTTSLAMPSYATEAYMKLFNAYPDTTVSFSLMVGCPNSEPLISNVQYRQYSVPKFIRTGKVPISILKFSQSGTELIGTFETNLVSKGQYAVVIGEKQSGEIGVYILDEKETKSTAFTPALNIDQRYSEVRLINLSTSSVSAIKFPGEVISSNLQSNFIGQYEQIGACSSNAKDSVIILSNDVFSNQFTTSFEVLEKYTIVVADSSGNPAKSSVLVPPSRITNLNGNSSIRVINLAYKYPTFDLAIASRSNTNDPLGYSSGTSLSKAQKYATISSPVIISPGELPISLFTTYSPVELLNTTLANIEADKEYLIIITNDQNGKIKMNLVEDNEENTQIKNIEETSFIQIINSVSRSGHAQISIGSSIPNAKLYFANTLATNIQIKDQNISFTINGITKVVNFLPKINSRYSLILCGDKDNPDYLLLENEIKPINKTVAERRFVNASQDLNSIWLVESIIKDTIPSANLVFKDFTFYDIMDKVKRYTFYFFNPDTKKSLMSFEIDVTLGKRYTLIFAGTSKNKFGYSVMQIQEY